MHLSTLSILLLPVALAHRHRYGPGSYHSIHHKPLSGSAPYPSSVSGAPYGLGNTTTVPGSTGFVTAVSTTSAVVPESSELAGVDSSSTVPTSSLVAINHAASSGGLDGIGATTQCDTGVVTVTENPVITVTVTEEGSSSSTAPSASVEEPVPDVPSSTPLLTTSMESVAESPSTPTSPPSIVETSSSSSVVEIPTASTQPTSTSELEAASPSLSSKSAPGPSTVTVIPLPATDSETPTPSPSPSTAAPTTKQKIPATVISSSSSPKSTKPTTTSTSSPGGCPGKRGIIATAGGGHQDQGNISLAFASEPNICWIANWYSAPPPFWPKTKQFVPQMYGKSSKVAEWRENAGHALDRGEKIFFSFGEPEAKGRDLQSPQEAVDNYMELMNGYAVDDGVKLCSPAVLQPPEHLAWLAQFLDLCEARGCRIDMICIHWYDTTSAAKPGFPEFKRTVEKAIELGKGKKVWVDNFQANGIPQDVKSFLDVALPYLEGNDMVERYAYVPPLRTDPNKYGAGYRTDQFIGGFDTNGTLTDLGKYYANFKMGA